MDPVPLGSPFSPLKLSQAAAKCSLSLNKRRHSVRADGRKGHENEYGVLETVV